MWAGTRKSRVFVSFCAGLSLGRLVSGVGDALRSVLVFCWVAIGRTSRRHEGLRCLISGLVRSCRSHFLFQPFQIQFFFQEKAFIFSDHFPVSHIPSTTLSIASPISTAQTPQAQDA